MDPGADYEPFELVEEDGRTVLRLHATEEKRAEVEADKVHIIMDAIARGWDIDIQYADIDGSLDIHMIANRLKKDEKSKYVVSGGVKIRYSNINGIANFDRVSFSGGTDFRKASFSGNALFTDVVMAKPANFASVKFRENHVFKGLWNATLGRIERLHWQATRFLGFNTERVMDGASNPWLKRYIEDERWIQSWQKHSLGRRLLFFGWELTSHCGRSFWLWMFWVLVIAFIFGTIYANYTVPSWLPESLKELLIRVDPHVEISPDVPKRIPTFFTPYYFSIVTFTTLGFGDVKPVDLAGEIWLALEVLLGYIMLGGLIGILASRFARRS